MSDKMRIPVYLVFQDWMQYGESIYSTKLGIAISEECLHSGAMIPAVISIDAGNGKQICNAFRDHNAHPVFRVILDTEGDGL